MAKKRNLRVVDASESTSDLEAFNLYIEDELEELLDEQSNEEFGNIDYRTVEKKAKLSTWSAQDFSNIYLRYRPHLERHARRFLNNQTQVDEVVQDAFLYLMVTLPDLDSETGVLRFLKWKVRLICLDVLRASGRAIVNSIDAHAEMMADDPEISAGLEQADDAAIVKLALSKLNPRHREVLIASLYEEKSHEEVAAQIGLSENATRQLIFRARAAFKKALLGDDIDTEGMSVSAILSVAARRAAEEGKKVGAQAMIFVLFLVIGVGAFLNFGGRNQTQHQVAEGPSSTATSAAPEPSQSEAPAPSAKPVQPVAVEPKPVQSSVEATPSAEPTLLPDTAAQKIVAAAVSTKPLTFVTGHKNSSTNLAFELGGGILIRLTADATAVEPISNAQITVASAQGNLSALPTKSTTSISKDANGNLVITYVARLGYLYDTAGNVTNSTLVNDQNILVTVVLSATTYSVISSDAQLVLASSK